MSEKYGKKKQRVRKRWEKGRRKVEGTWEQGNKEKEKWKRRKTVVNKNEPISVQ